MTLTIDFKNKLVFLEGDWTLKSLNEVLITNFPDDLDKVVIRSVKELVPQIPYVTYSNAPVTTTN